MNANICLISGILPVVREAIECDSVDLKRVCVRMCPSRVDRVSQSMAIVLAV